ncbi:MAG TPA: hypothetical protein VHK69_21020 [Chitinophagaceae bacterium]|nr:hypothetical protein [Chitinophagaceae bacterium]
MFVAQKNGLLIGIRYEGAKVEIAAIGCNPKYSRLWEAIIKTEQLLAQMYLEREMVRDERPELMHYFEHRGWHVQHREQAA